MTETGFAKKERRRLGEILLEAGLINELQLARALGQHKQWGGKLGNSLIKMGFISEEDLAAVLESQLGIKWISLRDIVISEGAIGSMKAEVAKKYHIMPVLVARKNITVATNDPTDLVTLDTVEFILGKRIKPVIAIKSEIEWAIAKYYDGVETDEPQTHNHNATRFPRQSIPLSIDEHVAPTAVKRTVRNEDVIMALVSILIDKGLLDENELMRRAETLKGRNQ
ncbi:MAG: hypothetical protein HZA20_10905 [Nitrospirae bacterium]|nr:hypothetical protein [Nitrospirota bacterium]